MAGRVWYVLKVVNLCHDAGLVVPVSGFDEVGILFEMAVPQCILDAIVEISVISRAVHKGEVQLVLHA